MTTGATPDPYRSHPYPHDPATPFWPDAVDGTPEPLGLRGALTVFGACAGLGAVLAVAWWLLAPAAREASVPAEQAVASDGALMILSLVVGLAHGIGVVVRGGELGVSRVVVTFLAACVGATVATVAGLLLGATDQLAILGAALLWPVAFLVVVGFAEAMRYTVSHNP